MKSPWSRSRKESQSQSPSPQPPSPPSSQPDDKPRVAPGTFTGLTSATTAYASGIKVPDAIGSFWGWRGFRVSHGYFSGLYMPVKYLDGENHAICAAGLAPAPIDFFGVGGNMTNDEADGLYEVQGVDGLVEYLTAKFGHPVVFDNVEPSGFHGFTRQHSRDQVPTSHCTCGFYASWHPYSASEPASALNQTAIPRLMGYGYNTAFGLVEGYGKVLLGNRGFRCEKIRIRGILLPPVAGLRSTMGSLLTCTETYPSVVFTQDFTELLEMIPKDHAPEQYLSSRSEEESLMAKPEAIQNLKRFASGRGPFKEGNGWTPQPRTPYDISEPTIRWMSGPTSISTS